MEVSLQRPRLILSVSDQRNRRFYGVHKVYWLLSGLPKPLTKPFTTLSSGLPLGILDRSLFYFLLPSGNCTTHLSLGSFYFPSLYFFIYIHSSTRASFVSTIFVKENKSSSYQSLSITHFLKYFSQMSFDTKGPTN